MRSPEEIGDADLAGTLITNRNAITAPMTSMREPRERCCDVRARSGKFYFLISNVVTLNGGRRSETKSEPSVAVLADCGL